MAQSLCAVVLTSLVFLIVGTAGSSIDSSIPVPQTAYGILYNNPANQRAAVQLEVFIEVHCPDSLAAWPIVKQLSAYYGPTKLEVLVQQLPLPYHRNAFLATQGLYVIQNNFPDKVFDYIEANLNDWSTFTTARTVNKTELQVLDLLADLADTSTGIDKALFKAQIGFYNSYTKGTWKYAVTRENAGVPTFYLNGVRLTLSDNTTFNDWVQFLDPLINSATHL